MIWIPHHFSIHDSLRPLSGGLAVAICDEFTRIAGLKLGFAESAKSAVFFRILLSTWRHVAGRSLCHHIQLRHGVKAWKQANQGRCRASGTSHTGSSTQFDPSSLQPSCWWWVVSKRVQLVSLLDGCDDAGWNPILASNIQANYELYNIPDYSGTDSCFFQ